MPRHPQDMFAGNDLPAKAGIFLKSSNRQWNTDRCPGVGGCSLPG